MNCSLLGKNHQFSVPSNDVTIDSSTNITKKGLVGSTELAYGKESSGINILLAAGLPTKAKKKGRCLHVEAKRKHPKEDSQDQKSVAGVPSNSKCRKPLLVNGWHDLENAK
jgi:hypothetical protein